MRGTTVRRLPTDKSNDVSFREWGAVYSFVLALGCFVRELGVLGAVLLHTINGSTKAIIGPGCIGQCDTVGSPARQGPNSIAELQS